METSDHLVVFTTCPDGETAERLARLLVETRQAACVNILPGVRSCFLWEDKINLEQEHLLLVKTRREAFAQVEALIRAHHPYSLPEVIALPITFGSADYLNWINSLVEKNA